MFVEAVVDGLVASLGLAGAHLAADSLLLQLLHHEAVPLPRNVDVLCPRGHQGFNLLP